MATFQVAYTHHDGSLSLPIFCEFESVQLPPSKYWKYLFPDEYIIKNKKDIMEIINTFDNDSDEIICP